MILKSIKDVELFIKILNNKQIEDIKIRYYSNYCVSDIEKIPINLLNSIKVKFIEYKNLLKILDTEYQMLHIKMNYESGFFVSSIGNDIEIYENNEYQKKSFESLKKQDVNECYQISLNYMLKINQIQKKKNIVWHIMSYCNNIIYYSWKKYYDKLYIFDNNIIFILPKLLNNSIGYNIFFDSL